MALSNPVPLLEFFSLLPVATFELAPNRQDQITGTQGGEIITAQIAPPLWQGRIVLGSMPKRRAAGIAATLNRLATGSRRFEVQHPHQIGPETDRLGVVMGSASPEIAAVPGDPSRLEISGMPTNFQLKAGDFFSFDYDPGTGTRRAFHQVVTDAQADGAGAFSEALEVVPDVLSGAAAGASVRFVRPTLLAVLVPGSIRYGTTRGNVTSGMEFSFRQTVRA